jgi:hypothetical protein
MVAHFASESIHDFEAITEQEPEMIIRTFVGAGCLPKS